MRLESTTGPRVILRPLQYEFDRVSAGTGRDWDANWLVVQGEVRGEDGREWSFTQPCLTTGEAQALGSWLRGVASGAVVPTPLEEFSAVTAQICFTEPNIALSLGSRAGERLGVRVHLSLEALPPWIERDDRPEIFAFGVLLDLTVDELIRAADDWEDELAPFPER